MRYEPLTIQTPAGRTVIMAYQIDGGGLMQPRDTIVRGPVPPASVTRSRGDARPKPTPIAFRASIPSNSLTNAYAEARITIEAAKAAIRISWHGGAANTAALTRYAMEPDGPDTIMLTLEWLPAGPAEHLGERITLNDTAWTAEANTTATATLAPNTSPIFDRPTTDVIRVTRGSGSNRYLGSTPIGGTPYDPVEVDILAVIRPSATPTSSAAFGLLIGGTGGQFTSLELGAVTLSLLNVDGWAAIANATLNLAPVAGEWFAFRLHARRGGPNLTLTGRAWSRRTHPNGEPTTWQITGTRTFAADLTKAGASVGLSTPAQYVDIAHLATAYAGAMAPTVRL